MAMKVNLETRVGLFFIIGLIMVFSLTVYSGRIVLTKGRETLYFHVPFADAVKSGTSIRYRGLEVGTVHKVSLTSEGIIVEALMDPMFVHIPDNVYFSYKKDSFLGIGFINLVDNEKPTTGFLRAGERYDNYYRVPDLDDIKTNMNTLLLTVQELVDQLDQQQLIAEYKAIGENTNKLLTEFNGVGSSVDSLLITYNLAGKELNRFILHLDSTVASIDLGDKSDSLYASLQETLKNINELALNVDSQFNIEPILADVKNITANIDSGDGILTALITDEELKENVKEVTSRLKKFSELADKTRLEIEARAAYGSSHNRIKGDLGAYIYPAYSERRYYYVGLGNYPVGKSNYSITETDTTSRNSAEVKETNLTFGELGLNGVFGFKAYKNMLDLEMGLIKNYPGVRTNIKPLNSNKLRFEMSCVRPTDPNLTFLLDGGISSYISNNLILYGGYFDPLNKERSTAYFGVGLHFDDSHFKYLLPYSPF